DLIVGSPGQDAAAYVAVLAAVRDAVAAVNPQVRVAGTASDTASIGALGASFRASGRAQPIMAELAFRSAAMPDYGNLGAGLGAAAPVRRARNADEDPACEARSLCTGGGGGRGRQRAAAGVRLRRCAEGRGVPAHGGRRAARSPAGLPRARRPGRSPLPRRL